jgi:hypothetical protein
VQSGRQSADFRDEVSDSLHNARYVEACALCNGDSCAKREPAHKNRETPQKLTLRCRQQLVAPVECGAERSVPCQGRTTTSRQQREAIPEANRHLFKSKRNGTRRGKLDRQCRRDRAGIRPAAFQPSLDVVVSISSGLNA